MKNYDLARIAYEAYLRSSGGVSLISGAKLPEFQYLRPAIQDAWWEVGEAVRREVEQQVMNDRAREEHPYATE